MFARLRGKFPGHEADLYEWANVIFQQAIINLIDVREIVDGFSRGIFIVQANFIMQDRVKSDVLESGRRLDLAKVMTIALAE
jgi:hypothetical protein